MSEHAEEDEVPSPEPTVKLIIADVSGHTEMVVTHSEAIEKISEYEDKMWIFVDGIMKEKGVDDWRTGVDWASVKEVKILPRLVGGPRLFPQDDLRVQLRRHFVKWSRGLDLPPKYAVSTPLLDELVRIKPRTKNALEDIKGMGPRRMESWEGILGVIDQWLMIRCVNSIRSNLRLLEANETTYYPKGSAPVLKQVLDDISEHFVAWSRGRGVPPKRTSLLEARRMILEELGPWNCTDCENRGRDNFDQKADERDGALVVVCRKCKKYLRIWSLQSAEFRVGELRKRLVGRGMVFSPSRLSQIITSMVKDGLIVRKKPTPFEKGIVILELTEKGLQTVNEPSPL